MDKNSSWFNFRFIHNFNNWCWWLLDRQSESKFSRYSSPCSKSCHSWINHLKWKFDKCKNLIKLFFDISKQSDSSWRIHHIWNSRWHCLQNSLFNWKLPLKYKSLNIYDYLDNNKLNQNSHVFWMSYLYFLC